MVMVMLLALPGAQGLASDHVSTTGLPDKLVTVVVGLFTLVRLPLPCVNTQVPMPPVGVWAARVVLAVMAQTVWLLPALAMLGTPTMTTCIVEVLGTHTPLLVMLHCIMLTPTLSVTWVVAMLGLAKVPPPCRNDQVNVSVPAAGVLAETETTELVTQSVWLGVLIVTVVGAGLTYIKTTSKNIGQAPFCKFHCSALRPKARLVTVLLPAFVLVTIAVPKGTVQ